MRSRVMSAMLIVVALAACRTTGGGVADEQRIRDLIEANQAANNAGDVEGWVALFEDDAVYMPPGGPATVGRSALREAALAGFTAWETAIDIVPEEVVVAGEWAFARTHVVGTVVRRGGTGETVTIDNKQIVVYHRDAGGTWRIARLITNANRS